MATAVENALAQLKDSAREKKLVVVIGTGVSMALTNGKNSALSWRGLIENGFVYGLTKGRITPSQKAAWQTQLSSNDMDDLLGAAEFMSRKLDAPNGDLYARWLESIFKDVMPENAGMMNAIRALQSAEIPLCTLNYDSLLERVTGLSAINFGETSKVAAWMRREGQGILHLHGSWDIPSSCVLGIRDYETTISNDVRDLIQRTLSSFARLLFVGCGDTFADPNFSALIKWLREKMKTAAPQHYALVNAAEEAARHTDSSWHGFVEPISYGPDRQDLAGFLLKQFPTVTATKRGKAAVRRAKSSPSETPQSKVLEEYRKFLIKDCGQMTIEGVRADMDMAQRRFDLERLFVPLRVSPPPPDIPPSDPERERKLQEWQEKNKKPFSFGQVFKRHRHVALLALPGGGKSLLLKRLAVAYADPPRRTNSDDELPDLDLTPVLIRCREWREYIHRPIPVLLANIAIITGQPTLSTLGESLTPLLEKGHILLLIDGLDEIHSDSDRSIFVEHLESFLAQYNKIRLVVTSREAGFSLVAPSIARFCDRWRIAPLQDDAIVALCDQWHRLMAGDSPESTAEAREFAQRLLQNNSLRRLAENPLLLTMLLVVKHGAGRLPPDRVSLYDRAIEVLLDTWNIRGHEPLSLKEAVPQLACVAFELMRKGKQTATEKELLVLLEGARERVPQIRRYAMDTPDKFLKRVELRSSLLVEAGHQLDGARTVPFYQFRHLTFQEHLAAVAAVEGHYLEYRAGDTVLTPLQPYLVAEDWKEVIPMAAVLSGKQAEPLITALLAEATQNRDEIIGMDNSGTHAEWTDDGQYSAAEVRLVQCFAEEAEASPETLTASLKIIAQFGGHGDAWEILCRGPYGEELLHQLWLFYSATPWRDRFLYSIRDLIDLRTTLTFWRTGPGQEQLHRLLSHEQKEQVFRGLITIVTFVWGPARYTEAFPLERIEGYLLSDDLALAFAASWAWGLAGDKGLISKRSAEILDRVLSFWFRYSKESGLPAFVLTTRGLQSNLWKPILAPPQQKHVRDLVDKLLIDREKDTAIRLARDDDNIVAGLIVAFHAGGVWSDEDLLQRLSVARDFTGRDDFQAIIKQISEQISGQKSEISGA